MELQVGFGEPRPVFIRQQALDANVVLCQPLRDLPGEQLKANDVGAGRFDRSKRLDGGDFSEAGLNSFTRFGDWTAAGVGGLTAHHGGQRHLKVVIDGMLQPASGLVWISFVGQQVKQDFGQPVTTLHLLAVNQTGGREFGTFVGDVFEIAPCGQTLDHFGGGCWFHAKFGSQVTGAYPRIGTLLMKFVHHLKIFIFELLKMADHGESRRLFYDRSALNTFVQAGHLTEPSWSEGTRSC